MHRLLLKKIKSLIQLFRAIPKIALCRLRGYFKDPLFLFQMGKVGSKTHATTLAHLYHVYHLHERQEFELKFRPYRKGCRGRKFEFFDVITITRDPLGRKISAYFQNLVGSPHYGFTFESREAVLEAGMDELIARFHAWEDGIQEATQWFERNFEPATGIRIYKHGFDPRKGWQIFQEGKWRVLVLRFEDIRTNHLEALNQFVVGRYGESARLSSLLTGNMSSLKWYAELMNEFRRIIRYSEEDINEAYGSRYADYFYTEEELEDMRSKWRGEIAPKG